MKRLLRTESRSVTLATTPPLSALRKAENTKGPRSTRCFRKQKKVVHTSASDLFELYSLLIYFEHNEHYINMSNLLGPRLLLGIH